MRLVLGSVSAVFDTNGFVDGKYDESLNKISKRLFFHYSKIKDLKLQLRCLGLNIDCANTFSEDYYPWLRKYFNGIPVVCVLSPDGDKVSQLYTVSYLSYNKNNKTLSRYYRIVEECAKQNKDTVARVLTSASLESLCASYKEEWNTQSTAPNSIDWIATHKYVDYSGCDRGTYRIHSEKDLIRLIPFSKGRFILATEEQIQAIKDIDRPVFESEYYASKIFEAMADPFFDYSYKGQDVWGGLPGCWTYVDSHNEKNPLLRIPTIKELCDSYWKLRKEDEFDYAKYFKRVQELEAKKKKNPSLSFLYKIKPPMEEHVGRVSCLTRAYSKLIDEQIIRLISFSLSAEDKHRISEFNKWYRSLHVD